MIKLKTSLVSLIDKIREKWIESLAILVIGFGIAQSQDIYKYLSDKIENSVHYENVLSKARSVLGHDLSMVKYHRKTGEETSVLALMERETLSFLTIHNNYISNPQLIYYESPYGSLYDIESYGFFTVPRSDSSQITYFYTLHEVSSGTCCTKHNVNIYDLNGREVLMVNHNVPHDSGAIETIYFDENNDEAEYDEKSIDIAIKSWVNDLLGKYTTIENTSSAYKQWRRIQGNLCTTHCYNEDGPDDFRFTNKLKATSVGKRYTANGCSDGNGGIWSIKPNYHKSEVYYEIIFSDIAQRESYVVFIGGETNSSWRVESGIIVINGESVQFYISKAYGDAKSDMLLYYEEILFEEGVFYWHDSKIYSTLHDTKESVILPKTSQSTTSCAFIKDDTKSKMHRFKYSRDSEYVHRTFNELSAALNIVN